MIITVMNTRIEIILGCMFSGKSTELLRRCNRYHAIGKTVTLINHALDTRTDDSIKTHDGAKSVAIKLTNLMDFIHDKSYRSILYNSSVIGIDEAQFFDDLVDFVLAIENLNKIVIIAGLDGDSERKPFGKILQCIPLCDSVVKLTALDMVKKDGTPAVFSKRISKNNDRVLIGNDDSYVAVSRSSYLT
jgi:thymidine kinase